MSDALLSGVTGIDPRVHSQGHGVVSYGRPDDQQYVRFFEKVVEDGVKSAEAGRPVHKILDYVEIGAPAAKNRFAGPATDQHKQRFPQHWANYEANRQNPAVVGTALEHCTFLDRATCEDLRALKILTAEQLASLDDAACSRIGPLARNWKAQAEAFLKTATDTAFATRQAAENAEMKAELQALREEVANLRGAVARGEAPSPDAPAVATAPAAPAIDVEELTRRITAQVQASLKPPAVRRAKPKSKPTRKTKAAAAASTGDQAP